MIDTQPRSPQKENHPKVMNTRKRINYSKILLWFFAGGVFAFLVVPSVLVVPMSFSETEYLSFPPKGFSLQWHQKFFTDQRWVGPTLFSLKVAFSTTFLSLVIGTMASLAMVRGAIPGKRIMHVIVDNPYFEPKEISKALKLPQYGGEKASGGAVKKELKAMGLMDRQKRFELAMKGRG